MRSPPIIVDCAIAVVMWMTVRWAVRQRRARIAADHSPRALRSYRLHNAAVVSAAIGVTWFLAWLSTDVWGPHWLHALAVPAAVIFLAVGAGAAGYAGWLGGP